MSPEEFVGIYATSAVASMFAFSLFVGTFYVFYLWPGLVQYSSVILKMVMGKFDYRKFFLVNVLATERPVQKAEYPANDAARWNTISEVPAVVRRNPSFVAQLDGSDLTKLANRQCSAVVSTQDGPRFS